MDPIPQHFTFHGLRIVGNHPDPLLATFPEDDLGKNQLAGRLILSACSIENVSEEEFAGGETAARCAVAQ